MSAPHAITRVGGLLAVAALLAAACGSARSGSPANATPTGPPTATLPMATSLAGPSQPGWAVVEMGGSAASHNNFWELFARQAGSTQWKLATPLGVASNGGLVVAGVGTGLVAGFGPSQDLTFSPLATTASPAAAWSQGSALVSPGLASTPDALASGPDGQLLALTHTGEVLLGSHGGATWTRLATLRSAADSAAGRACGLTALTAVAFTPQGIPVAAGTCSKAGTVGIFAAERGVITTVAVPSRPAGLRSGPATVLGLTSQAGRMMAIIEAGTGRTEGLYAAWQPAGSARWSESGAVAAGGRLPRSLAMWANGSVAVVLADGRGQTVAGPAAGWRSLPPLPVSTATLAIGDGGQLEALSASGGNLTVWQLAAHGAGWTRLQVIKVAIPYGSSS